MADRTLSLRFPFDGPAVGKALLGRERDIEAVADAIQVRKTGVVLYDPPKSGKDTVIRNAFSLLESRNYPHFLCEIDLGAVRSYPQFIARLRQEFRKCLDTVGKAMLLPFDIDIERLPEERVPDLPQVIAAECGRPVIVYIREFQNVLEVTGKKFTLEEMEKRWTRHRQVRYVLTGSCVNRMKHIFEERMLFYYLAERIRLSPLDDRRVTEHIVQALLDSGRVITPQDAAALWRMSNGNLWYARQLCTIAYSYPIGYVNSHAVQDAHRVLISLHQPRFVQMMLDLTSHQINLLRAIVEGEGRFSSAEVIARYGLNSSANVFRLKEALRKKEIVTFDRRERARILDPLFEYWLRHFYFYGP